jgi:hypothetical protein
MIGTNYEKPVELLPENIAEQILNPNNLDLQIGDTFR